MDGLQRALCALLLCLFCASAAARLPEGVPPTRHFTPDAGAFPQNTSIAIDGEGRIFLGGFDGLLIYDGADWRLLPTSNGDLVRSVASSDDGRVYVGGYDAFGYVQRDASGAFSYQDLSARFSEALAGERFADIWHVLVAADAVYFVALQHVFRFEPETGAVHLHRTEGRLGYPVELDGRVYLQFRGEGLRRWHGAAWVPVDAPAALAGRAPTVAVGAGEAILFLFEQGPWLRFDGAGFEELPGSRDVPFRTSVTAALTLPGDTLALATNSGRVVLFDARSGATRVFPVADGFLSGLTYTPDGDLLVADDLGFTAVRWPSVWVRAGDGIAGNVYRVVRHAEQVYALTSSGVFRAGPEDERFERLPWTNAEGWDLLPLGDGTFLFADSYRISLVGPGEALQQIGKGTTARRFLRSPFDEDRVYVGTELGVQVLDRRDGRWQVSLRDDDLDNLSITHMIETAPGELWVGSERGGVRRLRFVEADGSLGFSQERLGPEEGLVYGEIGAGAYLFEIGGALHAFTETGVFRWSGERFESSSLEGLTDLAPAVLPLSYLEDGEEAWAWSWSQLFHRPAEGAWKEVDVSGLSRGALSSVARVGEQIVVGILGALLVHDGGVVEAVGRPPPVQLVSARVFGRDGAAEGQPLVLDRIRFSSEASRLTLQFAMPDLVDPGRIRFRTRLRPLEADFSPWSDADQQSFVSLGSGRYTLEVQGRDGRGRIADLEVPILVEPRWFELPVARAVALLLALLALRRFVIWFARRRSRALRQERDRLETLVEARTAELVEANSRLDAMAHLDGLTQIPNRRRLDDYLAETWMQSTERGRILSLAMIDVDHFKQFNDSFGHQAGDDLLVALAELLTASLRRSEDLVARYGGEEFLVVLPGADVEAAGEVVEAMRRAVAESGLGVTISAGVYTCAPDPSDSLAGAVAAADTALYRAKQGGRDRVEAAPAPDSGSG